MRFKIMLGKKIVAVATNLEVAERQMEGFFICDGKSYHIEAELC